MRLLRRRRDANPTRVWVTITARRLDPVAMLEQVAAAHGQPTLESISFDGESAAVELRMPSITSGHAARELLGLDEPERERLARILHLLHADATVQDLLLESHVGGDEHVADVAVLDFDTLIQRVLHGQLRAGVRYVSD